MKTPELNSDYEATRRAALTLSTKLIATLPQDEVDALDRGIKQGARLVLEIGPLPDCQIIKLVLIEREGARHQIAALGATI